jgi:protein-S-isoprenylcysteine O-methyltransferase Ste14
MNWISLFAQFWEAIPLFTRAVYMGWIIYAVFYWVILHYEKEHKLIKPRKLSNVNFAYSFYALLFLTIVLERHFSPIEVIRDDPPLYQSVAILGYLMMAVGLLIVIFGRITLNGFWGAGIFKYEPNFKEFVQSGLYRLVRHPVYFGQILLALGMFLIMNNWILVFFPSGAIIFNIIRANAEEGDLLSRVGEPYSAYRNQSHFIVPWIW